MASDKRYRPNAIEDLHGNAPVVRNMDLNTVASGLHELRPGFWVANRLDSVSYPEHGHSACFDVEDSSYWFRHRNSCVASIVGRFPPAGAIVDIGGGNGFVSLGLQEAGFETLLIEPGPNGARNGFARGLRPVAQSTFEDAGFKPQTLPAVGLFDVIEHIEDDVGFLQGLQTTLRPQGRVYVTVPAFGWLWSPEDVEAGHFRRYNRSSLTETLESAGFQVEFATYLFWLLPLPVFILRSLAGKLGIRKAGDQEQTRREHRVPGGAQAALLSRLLAVESGRIQRGKAIPFGSSVLAVARKG